MNINFIGGGHMTSALVGGLVKQGVRDLLVVDRNQDKRQRLQRDFSVAVASDLSAIEGDIIVLAVRPSQVKDLLQHLPPKGTLVSIAAGIRMKDLMSWWKGKVLVRAMPNTPSQLGIGMTVCCPNESVDESQKEIVAQLFSAVGKVAWLETGQESLLEAVTAVSGSGPAYVYYFIEAMQQAALRLGVPNELVMPLILQTFRGAVEMVEKSEEQVRDLRLAVAVKGGTTERAIEVMKSRRFSEMIESAMVACAKRAHSLGDELSDAE